MTLLQRDPPVDWNRVLLELRKLGWTAMGIGRALNIPHSTILGWCNDGHQPRFEEGRALLKLHEQEMKKRNPDTAGNEAGLQDAGQSPTPEGDQDAT